MPLERPKFEKPLISENKPEENVEKIDPEFVEKLERSNLTINDKVNLLLTKAGLKPASELRLIITTETEEGLTRNMSEEEIQGVIQGIRDAGIPHKIGEKEIIKEKYEYPDKPGIKKISKREKIDILVGHSQKELNSLIEAVKQGSDEAIARAFGFPSTAVEAFIGKRKKLKLRNLPLEIQKSDALLFSSSALSEDNWQEEIKQGQIYADFIKKISPAIYREMKITMLRSHNLKESAWEEQKKEVENWRDVHGEPIESGIRETIVALHAMGLSTSSSCEGHSDHGVPAPWVHIEAPNEPEERFIGEKEILQKIAEKYNVSPERIKKMETGLEAAVREFIDEGFKKGETPEYQKYREKNKKLIERVRGLLNEFYQDRETPEDIRLTIREIGPERMGRLSNEGKDYNLDLENLTSKEKAAVVEKLSKRQEEMREFTKFLREKYFSE